MRPFYCLLFVCLAAFFASIPTSALGQDGGSVVSSEDDAFFSLGGLFQGRMSYVGHENGSSFGPGVRRMRLIANASVSDELGAFMQIDLRGGAVSAVDGGIAYTPSPDAQIRAGRFVIPQPGAAASPGGAQIDAVDRASIGEWWASRFTGGRRDFGVDLQYQVGQVVASATLHSGDGAVGNFIPSVWSRPAAATTPSVAAGSAFLYRPERLTNFEIGVYGGYNPNAPVAVEFDMDAAYTGSAHVYWGRVPGSQPLRIKADYISAHLYQPDGTISQDGASLLAAIHPAETIEFFARGEVLRSDIYSPADRTLFLTSGIHYSLSARQGGPFHRQRVTLAVSAVEEQEGLTYPVAVLQFQLAF